MISRTAIVASMRSDNAYRAIANGGMVSARAAIAVPAKTATGSASIIKAPPTRSRRTARRRCTRQYAREQPTHSPFRDQANPKHDHQRIGYLDPERTCVFIGDLSLDPSEQERRIDEDRRPGKNLIAEGIDAV